MGRTVHLPTGMSMVLSKWIITPIKVGWIRPGYVGEITQLIIDSYDQLPAGHPSRRKKT